MKSTEAFSILAPWHYTPGSWTRDRPGQGRLVSYYINTFARQIFLNMASAFWTLEDGRGFARRWSGMAYMLELITDELKAQKEAEEFYEFLVKFVFRQEIGDEYNGFGGFIRKDENIMFNFDLRTFAPQNRDFFWKAAQKALNKLKVREEEGNQGIILLLTTLMDMHKRISRGEDPTELNDMRVIKPEPNEKLGPGW